VTSRAAALPQDPRLDADALDRRLAELRSEREAEAVRAEASRTASTALGLGFRIGIELVVAVGVCAAIGWAIDRQVGSAPWGMLAGFVLGFGAGLRNLFRTATRYGERWDAAEAADRAAATKDR
jgi:ATP synthase protein I